MSNTLLTFTIIDALNNPYTGSNIILSPYVPPYSTSSFIVTGLPKKQMLNDSGSTTFNNVVGGLYRAEIRNNPEAPTIFYLNVPNNGGNINAIDYMASGIGNTSGSIVQLTASYSNRSFSAISSSYALTASYSLTDTQAVSASYASVSSNALSSSYVKGNVDIPSGSFFTLQGYAGNPDMKVFNLGGASAYLQNGLYVLLGNGVVSADVGFQTNGVIGFTDQTQPNGVAIWTNNHLTSSNDITPDSVTTNTVNAQILRTSGTPGVAPFTNVLNLDGTGIMANGNISWDTVGNLSVGGVQQNKIGQDGAGWLADNAINWNAAGNINFAGAATFGLLGVPFTIDAGGNFSRISIGSGGETSINGDGSGTTSGGGITWDTAGNITIGNGSTILGVDGSGQFSNGLIIWDSGGDITVASLNAITLSGDGAGITGVISSSYSLTASYASSVTSASYASTSSWAKNVISSSYSLTSSYARNAGSGAGGTTLGSGSSYNITSSWSTNSLTASFQSKGYNIPITQFGSASVSTATSNIFIFPITMPSTNYSVALSANSAISNLAWGGKTTSGFTSSMLAFSGIIDYICVGNQ